MKDNVIAQYGSIDDWDISAVTNLRFVFQDKSTFNADLSKWNTWSVEKMSFGKCVIFCFFSILFSFVLFFSLFNINLPIPPTPLIAPVFYFAKAFNSDLSKWNTQKVTDMKYSKFFFWFFRTFLNFLLQSFLAHF